MTATLLFSPSFSVGIKAFDVLTFSSRANCIAKDSCFAQLNAEKRSGMSEIRETRDIIIQQLLKASFLPYNFWPSSMAATRHNLLLPTFNCRDVALSYPDRR